MKLYKKILMVTPLAVAALSCSQEAPVPVLEVAASATEVGVGEPVTLSITHNLDGLSVYNGEAGHEWQRSAAYNLAGRTEQELRDSIFRPLNPDVKPFAYDFSDAEPGAATIGGGVVELRHTSMGTNLLPAEGSVVYDPAIGGNLLRITSTHPEWWYQGLRINLNSKLGANRMLTLRMRFEKDFLSEISTGSKRADVPTFGVVIRLAGVPMGGGAPVFSEVSVWDVYWAPSLASKDYSVDLARIVTAWEAATGKKMERLAYAQILFTAVGSVGYVGDYYIEKISYGSHEYAPWDTGEGLNTGLGGGTVKYTHRFSAPGVYEMVVAGNSTSLKNYSGSGYHDDLGNKISGSEYRYGSIIRSVKITVK